MSVYLWILDTEILGAGVTAKAAEEHGLEIVKAWNLHGEAIEGGPAPEELRQARFESMKARAKTVAYSSRGGNFDALLIKAILGSLPTLDELEEVTPPPETAPAEIVTSDLPAVAAAAAVTSSTTQGGVTP